MTRSVDSIERECGMLENGIAAVDVSSSGLLLLHGKEAKDFLQRISTNNCAGCLPGTAVQTVLVNEKAKIIDAVLVVALEDALLMVTSPGQAPAVKAWLERFIIMEDITVEDKTDAYVCSIVLGAREQLTPAFPFASRIDPPFSIRSGYVHFSFFDHPAVFLIYKFPEAMESELAGRSIPVVSHEAYERFRIRHGIPAPGREITGMSNPLEAGLKRIVSFTKGCYIGQEVIARLDTYKKVQRLLCLVRLEPCPADATSREIIGENGIHGYITTILTAGAEHAADRALAIIKSPEVGARYTMENGAITVVVEQLFE